jgi:hypothetical protein
MYRDDLAAAHARLEQLQRELAEASSQGIQDRERIAALTAQLGATRDALTRMGSAQPAYGAPMYGAEAFNYASRAGTVLVLGILSIVLCHVLGPVAWAMGNEELRRIDAGQTSGFSRGNVTAGRVCGIVGTVLLLIGAFFVVVVLGFASQHRGY